MRTLIVLVSVMFLTPPAFAGGLSSSQNVNETEIAVGGVEATKFVTLYWGNSRPNLDTTSDLVGAYGTVWRSSSPFGAMLTVNEGSGATVGLGFGQYLSSRVSWEALLLRFDYGTTQWFVDFAGAERYFSSNISSTTALLGMNYELPIADKWNLSFGAFAGVSRNKLSDAEEGSARGPYATVLGNTEQNLAYMLSTRAIYELSSRVNLSANLWLIDIGSFKSGGSRSAGGRPGESYAPQELRSGLEPVLALGVQYRF